MSEWKPTPTQRRALKWLAEHNGTGVLTSRGGFVAGGETAPFEAVTWLRLVMAKRVETSGTRLTLTVAGREGKA